MLKENELIGAFTLSRQEVRPFTDKQIALVTSFAAQAVIAIENARLLNELRESLQQQTATADVLKVISRSTFDLQAVLSTLIELAARLCAAEMGGISLRDGDVFQVIATYGYSPEAERYAIKHPLLLDRGTATGRAALEGRAVHVLDVLADPEYRESGHQKAVGYRTILAVPLLRDGTTIGVFALTRREVHPFIDKQIELITTFADQAVIAIENVRLFDEVQARTREVQELLEYQTAISDVLNVISRSPNKLQPVLDTLVQTAARLCEADFSVFFRLHEGKCHIGASNAEDDFIKFARENPFVPTLSSCSGRALLERRTVHVVDASTDPEYAMPGYQLVANNRTMLAVPLLREGIPVGTITLWKTRVEPFTEKQIGLITTFANQALIAIENVRLFEAERQRAGASSYQQVAWRSSAGVRNDAGERHPHLRRQSVLNTLVESAARLCESEMAGISRQIGDAWQQAASYGLSPEYHEYMARTPLPSGRGSITGRVVLEKRAVQIPDVQADPDYAVKDVAVCCSSDSDSSRVGVNHRFGRYHATDRVVRAGTKRCVPASFDESRRRVMRGKQMQPLAVPAIDISKLKVERLITFSTSAVAVCCCSNSRSSLSSRVFSMAMTAWLAKLVTSAICLSVKGTNLLAVYGERTDQFVLRQHRNS